MAADIANRGTTEAGLLTTKSLRAGIERIYESKEYWDVEFTVGGKTFKCHRLVLGAMSPEFEKMLLNTETPIKHIVLSEVSKEGFEVLIRYIYTNLLGTTCQDTILEAYHAAERFQQEGLKFKCEELIGSWEINTGNVCNLLNKASEVPPLRQRLVDFLAIKARDVIGTQGFLEVTPCVLWDIFESRCLEKVPTLELLQNILRWGVNQFPKPTDYSKVRRALMHEDRPFLGQLGIQKLDGKQLADVIKEFPQLLTPDEQAKFFVNAHNPGMMPLPDWCC